jgi:hypothetical protein
VISWLFRSRKTGRITVAQVPNLSLGIFIGAWVVRRLFEPAGTVRTVVDGVALLALLWWAVDELVRGVNPWRRILGGTVLALQLAYLVAR